MAKDKTKGEIVLLLIGEKINVISKKIGAAMRDRDPAPIQEMAKSQVEAGANMLDINIGPATKNGPELMEWLVKTVQEVVDVPLSLDTTNAEAMEAGLKVHKGQALINSASGETNRLKTMVGLAAKYNTKLIGLTMREQGIPRDAHERVEIAVEIFTAVMEAGISPDEVYLDPLILPIAVAQATQPTTEVFESIKMFKQLNDPPFKTVVGLSNISNGAHNDVKDTLDATLVAMLMTVGLDAAIVDPFNKQLMNAVRTAQVFKNEILYCDSYLD